MAAPREPEAVEAGANEAAKEQPERTLVDAEILRRLEEQRGGQKSAEPEGMALSPPKERGQRSRENALPPGTSGELPAEDTTPGHTAATPPLADTFPGGTAAPPVLADTSPGVASRVLADTSPGAAVESAIVADTSPGAAASGPEEAFLEVDDESIVLEPDLDDVDALGPAFPDEPEDPAGAPTNALGVEAEAGSLVSGVELLGAHGRPTATTSAVDDAWAELDGSGAAWRGVTGESKVEHFAPAQGPTPRRNTNVLAQGSEVAIEEGARLLGEGTFSGQQFVLRREQVIGRLPACDITLVDPSVSREHARIYRDDDDFVVVDKKSGNGTFVNGTRISRHTLKSGDQVVFGRAAFRFVGQGEAVPAGKHPRARRQLPLAIYLSGAILAVTLLVGLVTVMGRGQGGSKSENIAFPYFRAGIEAFKHRDWNKAEGQFSIFIGLLPQNQHGRRYLEAIAREKQNGKQLQRARDAWSAGDLLQAYTVAGAIIDSVYSSEASELLRGIDAELDARVARARTALSAGKPSEAIDLLNAVEVIRPGRPDVRALLDDAQQKQGGVAKTAHSRTGVSRSSPAVERARSLVASGKLSDAEDLLRGQTDSEAKATLGLVRKLRLIYESAVVEHRAKRAATAIRLLEQAKLYESRITGGNSTLAHDIGHKLADMHYVEGIEAALAGRQSDALASFQAALASDDSHGPTRRKLSDMAARAAQLYAQGEAALASDKRLARERFRAVLQLVPPNDEHYRKAKQRLDALPQ